jgi:uncharacterized protein
VRTLLLIPMALAAAAPAACRAGDGSSAPSATADPSLPRLSGRVVDDAGILAPAAEARLAAQSAALEREIGAQYVVVTVPDLKGEAIEHFGLRLGRAWGVGHKGKDDGLLMIVAPHERKVRIEVGYGLESRVTDPFAAKVIREDIVPRFVAGDYGGGIAAGSADLIARLRSKQSDREIAAEDKVVT